ncbi:chorismate mutase [Corynebacterium hiratae]|uniref:Chorismate mutase n=2 Tax=Corynebacterium TaxID=1716 RepID=A0A553FYH2_9CORY|nr:chorismate mutase [Corynebacterium aurimucosum]TRX62308.1 chorismate mutase [Corynebacterium aurimucosum]
MSSSHPGNADSGLRPEHQDPNVVDNGLDIRMPSGTDDPLSDAEIQRYREEINRLDRVILDAIKRRTDISRTIGKTRMSSGGTRLVHTREIAILNEFRDELGEEGPAIASALLRLGRGKLGCSNAARTSPQHSRP